MAINATDAEPTIYSLFVFSRISSQEKGKLHEPKLTALFVQKGMEAPAPTTPTMPVTPSATPSASVPSQGGHSSVDQAMERHMAEQAITELRNTLRINPLMDMIERNLRILTREELCGALIVLGPLSSYLQGQCVEGQEPAFNKMKLVKTLEELSEIAMELSLHNGYDSDGEDSE